MVSNMDIYFLKQHRADLPHGLGWLTPPEARVYESLIVPKRRGDWLLGRWTAKRALQRVPGWLGNSTRDWQIMSEASGAPAVLLDGKRQNLRISLSHSHGRALCVLSDGPGAIGCDVERVEARAANFPETYFTADEQNALSRQAAGRQAALTTLYWSAKESVLKILGEGLRADTRRVLVELPGAWANDGWHVLTATDTDLNRRYTGWCRIDQEFAYCVMNSAPGARLLSLKSGDCEMPVASLP